jgi:hypothetical protein
MQLVLRRVEHEHRGQKREKVLGRPLICSDIPVHREHVPDTLGYFDPEKPEALAEQFVEIYGELRPGLDLQRR